MFPISDFPRSVGSFPQPVAIPATEPEDGEQVCVQFGRNWLPYVLGALQQLLLQTTWIYTTEDEVKAVQQSVFDLIAIFGNAIDTGDCLVNPTFQQPDDCTLQVSFDGGTTWSTIFNAQPCAIGAADNQIAEGIAAGIIGPTPVQPGPTTPPVVASCYNFHVVLSANGSWKIPFSVNDAWTITVSNAKGGSWDPDFSPLWTCPEGTEYILGACGAPMVTVSTDPLNTLSHMRLIMQIGSTFYDAYNQSQTVPNGTGAVDAYFQVNDANLSDNQGTYEFDIQVCNESIINLTYFGGGSGPATCNVGSEFDLTLGLHDPGSTYTQYNGGVNMDKCVDITIISLSTLTAGGDHTTQPNADSFDCATGTQPAVIGYGILTTNISECGFNSVTAGYVRIRIDRIH